MAIEALKLMYNYIINFPLLFALRAANDKISGEFAILFERSDILICKIKFYFNNLSFPK